MDRRRRRNHPDGRQPESYPWLARRDERFTLALVLDVGEVLARHGYPAPSGAVLVALTSGLYHALHTQQPGYPPLN